MKKFLVIGNPIMHSLSPKLHNHWFKKNDINAVYEKKLLESKDLPDLFKKIKNNEIDGINITTPFKNEVLPFLDEMSMEATKTRSVNTVYLDDNKIIGHNTDIAGFELALRFIKYDVSKKKVVILGAGGVSPSIIFALENMGCTDISLINRTKVKAEEIKKIFTKIKICDWGQPLPSFDVLINATSIGLKGEKINLNLDFKGPDKLLYDVIYNPSETPFIKTGIENGNKVENGKMMFIYQAHQSFVIWNKLMPKIDEETIKIVK